MDNWGLSDFISRIVPVVETVRLFSAYVSIFVVPAPHRVRDKIQRESSFLALDPCFFDFAQDRFRRSDIVDFRFPQQIFE